MDPIPGDSKPMSDVTTTTATSVVCQRYVKMEMSSSHHPCTNVCHSGNTTPPAQLVNELRHALALLYSLPTATTTTTTMAQAHSFLISFQSRNLRRKLQSWQQRQRDVVQKRHHHGTLPAATEQQQQQNHRHPPMADVVAGETRTIWGSTWWTCWIVLMQKYSLMNCCPPSLVVQQSTTTERLFCAQTLVHRLQRTKLVEAIDLEMELLPLPAVIGCHGASSSSCSISKESCPSSSSIPMISISSSIASASSSSTISTNLLLKLQAGGWTLHPLLAHFLYQQQHNNNPFDSANNNYNDTNNHHAAEESWKGQLTLNVLSVLVYLEIMSLPPDCWNSARRQPFFSIDEKPLLTTLASAMALTALRLQYPAQAATTTTFPINNNEEDPANHHPSKGIVIRIAQSLQLVIDAAKSHLQQERREEPDANLITFLFAICFGAIPDAIWCDANSIGNHNNSRVDDSSSGRTPRISMDPNILHRAQCELRQVGIRQAWEILAPRLAFIQANHTHNNNNQHVSSHYSIILFVLSTLKQWAEVMPLPLELIDQTIPLVNSILLSSFRDQPMPLDDDVNSLNAEQVILEFGQIHVAVEFLTAIFETSSVPLSQLLEDYRSRYQQSQGTDRRRTKAHAKAAAMSPNDMDGSIEWTCLAQAEYQHRGESACRAANLSWPGLYSVAQRALGLLHKASVNATTATSSPTYCQIYDNMAASVAGGGPLGCMVACTNACLPYLLAKLSTANDAMSLHQIKETFSVISTIFQSICSAPHRIVRSLTFESLLGLHKTVLEFLDSPSFVQLDRDVESLVVDHFAKCCIYLASHCGYSNSYFATPSAESDEELEVERNDVRDVLRTLAGSDAGTSTSAVKHSANPPLVLTLKVLNQLVLRCQSILSSELTEELFVEYEVAIHALSALAKPLNHLAATFSSLEIQHHGLAFEILTSSLQALKTTAEIVSGMFASWPLMKVFPLSRISNLATASLAPMLSAVIHSNSRQECDRTKNTVLCQIGMNTLGCVISASALSVVHIPELVVESAMDRNMYYDVRAAMRSPGGEDHVGCLALMRMAFESPMLARAMIESHPTIIVQLSQLHESLRQSEQERGRGVFHGKGVTPKSRRILLKTIALLDGMISMEKQQYSTMDDLFQQCVALIVEIGQKTPIWTADTIYRLCEATFDLSEFSVNAISKMFNNAGFNQHSLEANCVATLRSAALAGFNMSSTSPSSSELLIEWSRFRAALTVLIRNASFNDLTIVEEELVATLIQCECEVIFAQCEAGPSSSSPLFCTNVISENLVPAGVFIKLLGDVLDRCKSGNRCANALINSARFVLPAALHKCPQPVLDESFEDPRPTLLEAWLIAMCSLIRWIKAAEPSTTERARPVLVESCAACLSLLFYPSIMKSREQRVPCPGMSLDGPQSRSIMEYLEAFFQLGTNVIQEVAVSLSSTLHLPQETISQYNIGIVGAALFRGVQGALPPWSVEYLPGVYASLYYSFGKDPSVFGQFMLASVNARLPSSFSSLSSVPPGKLLSGPCFEGWDEVQKVSFVDQTTEVARCDSLSGWKRVKAIVKQACGGKKKESDFQQKPPPTNWEFERI